MAQGDLPTTPIDPGAESGTELAFDLGAFRDALHTSHSGSSRPAYVQPGMVWLDTTTANAWIWKLWTGTVDIPIFRFDSSNGKLKTRAAEASIASAATCDVLGQTTDYVSVTGSVTITSFGTTPNQIKFVRFTGTPILTHNATTLILPNNGNNMTMGVGDTLILVSDASGNARVYAYEAAAGPPAATIPSGTKMLFQQTSAPSGWSKDTTHDDKGIRVVSGTAGSGGTLSFSSVFGRTATDGTSLSQGNLPDYTLPDTLGTSLSNNTNILRNSSTDTAASSNQVNVRKSGSNDTLGVAITGSVTLGGSNVAHTHGCDIRVQYVDVIICTKS